MDWRVKISDHEEDLEPGVWYERDETCILFSFVPFNRELRPDELVDISAKDIADIKSIVKEIKYIGHGRGRCKDLDNRESRVEFLHVAGVLLSQHSNSPITSQANVVDEPISDISGISANFESNGDTSQSGRERTGWTCCNPDNMEDHFNGYLDEDELECWECEHKICDKCKTGTRAIGTGRYRRLGAGKLHKQKMGMMRRRSSAYESEPGVITILRPSAEGDNHS